MRLLTVGEPGREKPAIEIDGVVRDVSRHAPRFDSEFFGSDGLDRLRALSATEIEECQEVPESTRRGAPVAAPSKVICIGLNYWDHVEETGAAPPAEPIVFFKAPNTIVGPYDDVLLPPGSRKTDWEVELAIVIGRKARYLGSEADAEICIAGYTISNDISEREYQLERGGQWVKGKSCETFNPLGPVLVTADDLPGAQALDMWLSVNGQERQRSSTSQMIFSIRYIVWYLSQFMVLEPGDIVNTGTPAGVGLAQRPPNYLNEGDVIELGIMDLGAQKQRCRRALVESLD